MEYLIGFAVIGAGVCLVGIFYSISQIENELESTIERLEKNLII